MSNNNFEGTPHISAKKGDFPKVVLFPGDPLRAKWIAEKFFDNPKQINSVRNMFAFVGEYKGKKVAVMGSGMGIPSCGLYAHELYDYYEVETIIRIGTAGGLSSKAEVGKIVIFDKVYSESTFHKQIGVKEDEPKIIYANQEIALAIKTIADDKNLDYLFGLGASNDAFYTIKDISTLTGMGIDAVEMEAFGLYATAKRLGKNALAICTVSDNIPSGESMPSQLRQSKSKYMFSLELEYEAKN